MSVEKITGKLMSNKQDILDSELNHYLDSKQPNFIKIKELLENGASLGLGLVNAAYHGYIEIVEHILKIKYRGKEDEVHRAFTGACREGHIEIARLIINYGFKCNFSNPDPIYYACSNNHFEVVKYLVKIGFKPKYYDGSFIAACCYGYLDIVKFLVENGAEISCRDDEPLREAVDNKKLNVVKYLIKKGANVNAKNGEALSKASRRKSVSIVKYLVENGADININNGYALTSASYFGCLNIVKYLIEHGANVNADDDQAIESASKNNRLEIVKYLFQKGGDIDRAIFYASRKNKELLLSFKEKTLLDSDLSKLNLKPSPPRGQF